MAETNEIAEPYTIKENDGLKVPIQRYTVKKGDTLSSIAKIYGTTYQKLAEYNEISAPYSLKIGQVLNLIQVYDETIECVDSDNNPLGFVDYILYLENDIKVVGTTNKYGVSQRVTTSVEVWINEVDFLVEEHTFEEMGELI
ncbi:MAG: hypothetical protein KN64_10630 [Sulfurovum sp. AS07-7]|nr:MAG: hypothetical protein KN64_10630 [Sulfurovum sp. AS07-7]